MYIQITSKCNMRCDHCGWSCVGKGRNMTIETFQEAVDQHNGLITIGGGEPTLHPKFWQLIGIVLGESHLDMPPHIVSNGTNLTTSKALANLGRSGAMYVEFSYDSFHCLPDDYEHFNEYYEFMEEIKEETRSKKRDGRGLLGIRETTVEQVIPIGRGRRFKHRTKAAPDECLCEDIIVKPDGSVFLCGCFKDCIGSVHDGWELPSFATEDDYRCSTQLRKEENDKNRKES